MRTFVIESREQAERCGQVIASLELFRPMKVTVSEYRKSRSTEQNALYWKTLQTISERLIINGNRYSAETLHEHCKREFLPEQNSKGNDKWSFLPNGERFLVMSTTDLTTVEFSDYMEQVFSFGAENGVIF